MEWKFEGEVLEIREKIPEQITIDTRENTLEIWYGKNKYLRVEDYTITKEEILKLLRYLLSIG